MHEVNSHPASEQELNVEKKMFHEYKFKVAPVGINPINFDHAAEKEYKIHEQKLNKKSIVG